ncbi:hypothetical protein C7999DRAFT_31628 [Corynascus novoguineensis]|uniref:CENP-V/GFA domain-containing protein n=1 Tax=Corynascus novoguineensis TaxID=1126955 RepID=A0AAN7CTA8_9PEZI|nr:hypothetical protein C7999DRAFT_31628 [Corynascus novoguineensis]
MADAEKPTKMYRGSCHCGAYVYEIEAPEIMSASDCNCSICSKRGYLWLVPQKPLTVVRDEGKLVPYLFASKKLVHKFCGNCGTTVLATSDMFPQGLGLNVRTIQGLDLWNLETKTFNGADYDPKYVAPEFTGEEPKPAGLENGKTYYGSCHCGAVTTAVKLNGSLEDGTYKGILLECNCSFCRQGGYIWAYPTNKQLAIEGRDNVFYYTFARNIWRKLFCKTCGEHIACEANPSLTEDEIAALPEKEQKFLAAHRDTQPLNLRISNGLDLRLLKPRRVEGWKTDPQYVYP